MASIFTYDPDPPRVASPWLHSTDSPKARILQPDREATVSSSGRLADYGVTRLEAEPQEGPTEYKLHLLLRPRRTYSFSSTGTGRVASGSLEHEQQLRNQSILNESVPVLKSSTQSKQARLQSLTTQLLWRLQQSSPYHASSRSELVLPQLPETVLNDNVPSKPGKIIAGIEESRGALYEIGVSDDGTFVGLTKDEMDESLKNLRSMAASLGCNVDVARMVVVGDCEWYENEGKRNESVIEKREPREFNASRKSSKNATPLRHEEKLWVAEALITPDSSFRSTIIPGFVGATVHDERHIQAAQLNQQTSKEQSAGEATTEQLRITLTGPTTSGKSSLLGTLTTATLDNGRGKSRLSLLKHRHEIASGITSSVAQELIGYKNDEVSSQIKPTTLSSIPCEL